MGLVGRVRARQLFKMTPRFLDRTVAKQQNESQSRAGKGWDTLSLAVVTMPCLQNKGC